MAKELTSGERQVFTTPSSLASRMGVVKANAGDPVELATSELGKTLEFIAKRKSIQAEEKWKADVKVNSLREISKFSQDFRYNPSEFINKATGFRDGLLESAPKAFRDWTRTYLAQLITGHSNQIIDSTWKRDQKELLLKNKESNSSEMNDMDSILLEAPWQEHTKLFEEQFSARLQEMIDSYTAVYNTIPTSEQTGMPTPIEQGRIWKAELEQSRNLSIAQKMIYDAVEIDRQRIADGILVGDEINGWVGPSAVDDALKLVNEMMRQYEIHGITGRKEVIDEWKYLEAARPYDIDGPWSFLDLDQVERMAIKDNTLKHAESLVKQYKIESAALTTIETSNLDQTFELLTGGGQGAINDIFSNPEKLSDVTTFFDTNFVGATPAQRTEFINAWKIAQTVERFGKLTFKKIDLIEKNDEGISTGGLTFIQARDAIMIESANWGNGVTEEQATKQLQNYITGMHLTGFGLQPYLDLSKVTFVRDASGTSVPSQELIALGNIVHKYGWVNDSLLSMLEGASQLNPKNEEDKAAIINMAMVVGNLNDRAGMIPANIKFSTWKPLLTLHKQLKFLASNPEESVFTKDRLLERYLVTVAPDRATLDNKMAMVKDAFAEWNIHLEGREKETSTFEKTVQNYLLEHVKKQIVDEKPIINLFSGLREIFGFQDYPLKGMVPKSYIDAKFHVKKLLPLWQDLVEQHLVWSYGDASDILPSTIEDNLQDALEAALHEIGNQGWKAGD